MFTRRSSASTTWHGSGIPKLNQYTAEYKTVFLIESDNIGLFDTDELLRELRKLFKDGHQWKPDEV